MNPLMIIADTYRMATNYAREHNLAPREWIFVTEPRQILGRRGGRYVVLVTGERLPLGVLQRRGELLTLLRVHGFELIS